MPGIPDYVEEGETGISSIDDSPPQESTTVTRTSKVLREVLETVALTVIIFLAVRLAVQNFKVSGDSMFPTVHDGSLVLVNKVDYLFHSPQRGDVIVFRFPRSPSEDFIKRVIGVPGDRVRVTGRKVYVNHHALREPYIPKSQRPIYTYPASGTRSKKIPKNEYFVLGDNRNNSYDSHIWGYVPRHDIIGKALIAYWPLNEVKFFSF